MVAEASESPEAGGVERGGREPASTAGRSVFWPVVAMIIVGGVTPVVLYWLLFGRIGTVTPQQAKTLLRGADRSAVLVDVRPAATFATGHIDGAVNWPLDEILAEDAADLPAGLRDKTLLLVCDVGMDSAAAAAHLQAAGSGRTFRVRGGIQEWIRSTAEACAHPRRERRRGLPAATRRAGSPSTAGRSRRTASWSYRSSCRRRWSKRLRSWRSLSSSRCTRCWRC